MSKRKQVQVPIEKIQEQDRFIEAIAEKNSRFYAIHQTKPKYMIQTFGCQMNEHDSEKLCAMLDDMGYQRTMLAAECDLIIYNTCAVRENAELKVYGNLGQLKFNKRKNPDLKIAVCGCMMQQPHVVKELKSKYNHVDLVFGTHNLYKFPELLASSMESEGMLVDVWDVDGEVVEGLRSSRKFELKAFVNIMYGCNKFCTYCIVPYTRGKQRSREKEYIIDEVKQLVEDGYLEVTLLGQNVNAYGKDLYDDYTMANLLEDVSKTGIKRLRFVTSHPWDFTDEMIDIIAKYDNIMPYIHLPLQSGSDRILKLMGRRYTKESYLELYHKLKERISNCSITTDIIVGFPGETEKDFKDTLEVVKECKYDSAYTFIFSPRIGTPAAKMKDDTPLEVKEKRLYELNELVNKYAKEANERYVGKTVPVLIEGISGNNKNMVMGYTDTQKLVNVKASKETIGSIVPVKITEARTWSLNGEVVE